MSDSIRVKKTISVDSKLFDSMRDLSKITRIPQSRLMDEAIHDLLKKYEAPTKSKPR